MSEVNKIDLKFLTGLPVNVRNFIPTQSWGPFLETPGNLTGPKSYFENEVSRKKEGVLTSNEVYFVSLAENFSVEFSKLLKLSS